MDAWRDRLAEEIERWAGTPYSPTLCTPGRGVSCWGVAVAVMDAMHGVVRAVDLAAPCGLAWLSETITARFIARLVSRYPHRTVRDTAPDALLPGDVLFARSGGT